VKIHRNGIWIGTISFTVSLSSFYTKVAKVDSNMVCITFTNSVTYFLNYRNVLQILPNDDKM